MHIMSGRVGRPETGRHCIPTSFKQLMSSSLARKGEEKGEKNIYRARPSYQHGPQVQALNHSNPVANCNPVKDGFIRELQNSTPA